MGTQTLNLSQCKEYLRNIKDLEISCYQQKQVLEKLKLVPAKLQEEIYSLEHSKSKKPEEPTDGPASRIMGILMCLVVALWGVLIGTGCGLAVKLVGALVQGIGVNGILGVLHPGLSLFFTLPWLPYIKWGAIIGYAITFVFLLWNMESGGKKASREYPAKLAAYEKEQQRLQELIQKKKQQLSTSVPVAIAQGEEEYNKTRQLLKEYYDMGFIWPKYRGLVPICTIYEYLESGRCFSLLGHEGAYNLYESELTMNEIIGKLDVVIEKLDEISSSQYLLRQEIRQCNSQLGRISNTLDNIENNTALTQYYSSITASNTSFMSWLAALSYDELKRNR